LTSPSSNTLIIFDTETTGLIANSAIPLKEQPEIIELFALKLHIDNDLEEVGVWQSLFFNKKVPEEVTKITSITTAMLAGEPKFAQMVDSLAEFFLGVRWCVGHNLSFDQDMLLMELRRLGMLAQFPWPPKKLCTVEATETIDGFRQSLTALHTKLFGEGFDAAHRAESDVRATARCLRELAAQGIVKL